MWWASLQRPALEGTASNSRVEVDLEQWQGTSPRKEECLERTASPVPFPLKARLARDTEQGGLAPWVRVCSANHSYTECHTLLKALQTPSDLTDSSHYFFGGRRGRERILSRLCAGHGA